MFRFHGFHGLFISASILLASTQVLGQTIKDWSGEAGSYNDADSWDGELPSAFFGEIASISNGGTVFLNEPANDDPGGLILGRLNVDVGSLEIQAGGSLTVARDDFDIVAGNIAVGQTGEGRLSVLQGGEVIGESLSLAGSVFSTLTLGETIGGDAATVQINGASNLQRNTTIVGPNVDFSTQSLQFGGGHLLTEVITGNEHSPISVANTANLNGRMDVLFDGVQPAIGDAWNLVDAGSILGEFNNVNVTRGQLPQGTALVFDQIDGGDNGKLYEMSVAPRLVLSVNRRTGLAAIENLTTTETIDIDGYLVTSQAEVLDPTSWNSLQDQGLDSWAESNPSALHLGELSLTDSEQLGPESSINLGAIYSFSPAAFGEAEPSLDFSYHLADGTAVSGLLQFEGLHNNVVLTVDPETGEAAMQNQSPFAIDIDGYLITSESGLLNVEGWSSLEDDGQAGWSKSNPSANHLGELNLAGAMSLPGTGTPISLGTLLSTDGGDSLPADLTFEFHGAAGETFTGIVEYGKLSAENPLDCNLDSQVSSGDLSCILSAGGPVLLEQLLTATGILAGDLDGDGAVNFADFLQLSKNFGNSVSSYVDGDTDGDGEVNFADFLKLSQNFGKSSGGGVASVPEPIGIRSLLVVGLVLTSLHRRRKQV